MPAVQRAGKGPKCKMYHSDEWQRGGANVMIFVSDQYFYVSQTTIRNPEDGVDKNFAFDFSYWSHDRGDSHFADQSLVFNDLGIGVLESAWEGYNVSLFAYGQTGAGKSYSMVGYGEDKGIIPLACEEIFKRIDENSDSSLTFKVEASMMEIYNERVKDLFNPKNPKNQAGLKVRNDPKRGPFVDDLTQTAVRDYGHIQSLMDEGTAARTVASTNMNATSSRAHTIFQIIFTQTKINSTTMKATDKVSRINLVDLAGSERAGSTGAQGDRLREGAAINKSLSALGNCISALADLSTGRGNGARTFVPYRDSVLTWLLKESLGGNAKTIMIAAVSPADINYEETLSTLRYADRAKQIKNSAKVNEDPNEKLIRELREEIERLRKGVSAGSVPAQSSEEIDKMREEVEAQKMMMEKMRNDWELKLKSAEQDGAARRDELVQQGLRVGAQNEPEGPYFLNINEDPALSGAVCYVLSNGSNRVGKVTPGSSRAAEVAIKLSGVSIVENHACVHREDGGTTANIRLESLEGKSYVNGKCVEGSVGLKHGDRIIFGTNHIFHLKIPGAANDEVPPELQGEQAYSFAIAEMAAEQGGQVMFAQAGAASVVADAEARAHLEKMKQQFAVEKAEMEKQLAEEKRAIEKKAQADAQRLKAQGHSEAVDQMEKQFQRENELQQKRLHEQELAFSQRLAEQQRLLDLELERQNRSAASKRARQAAQEMLRESIMKHLPMVTEANDISNELQKDVRFELIVVQKSAVDRVSDTIKDFVDDVDVCAVRVLFGDKHDKLWSAEKFADRLYLMRDLLYNQGQDEGAASDDDDDEDAYQNESAQQDPFFDSIEAVLIGRAVMYLESLFYLISVPSLELPVVDFRGRKEGALLVGLQIFDRDGNEFDVDSMDNDCVEGLRQGTQCTIRLHVFKAKGLPQTMKCFHVECSFFTDKVPLKTSVSQDKGVNPSWDFEKSLPAVVDDGFMKYLQTGSLIFEVFGESTYDPAAVARTKRGQRRLDDRAMQLEDQAAKLAAAEQRLLESTKISSLGASSVGSLMLEEEEEAPDSFSPTAGSPSKAPEAAVDVNRQLQPTEADNDLASRKEILRAQIAEEEALRKLHESKSAWEKEKLELEERTRELEQKLQAKPSRVCVMM